jgi:hypothetical protein
MSTLVTEVWGLESIMALAAMTLAIALVAAIGTSTLAIAIVGPRKRSAVIGPAFVTFIAWPFLIAATPRR